MIYGLPENPTREDVRREYTIANMRFKELQGKMDRDDRDEASRCLGYVKDNLQNEGFIRINIGGWLSTVDSILSEYRRETFLDLKVALDMCEELRTRYINLSQASKPVDGKARSRLNLASNAIVNRQHPDSYTDTIDKTLFHLAKAEKLILEAEKQKPIEVEV